MFTEGVEDLRTKLVRVFYSPEFVGIFQVPFISFCLHL